MAPWISRRSLLSESKLSPHNCQPVDASTNSTPIAIPAGRALIFPN